MGVDFVGVVYEVYGSGSGDDEDEAETIGRVAIARKANRIQSPTGSLT